MKETIPAVRTECDGCGKVYLTQEIDEPAYGFHGSVIKIDGAGGNGGDWYACSVKCIHKAVIAAVDRR